MKRGWWLLLVTFIMSLPIVSAKNSSIMGLFLGTEDNSIFFLRVIYFILLFIILYNVSRKTVFQEENENKRATMFVLAFALMAEHVTPDAWITSFGWVLTILGPVIVFWWVMGLFFKNRAEDAGFNWTRLILTIVALVIFLLVASGSTGFSKGIGGLPGIGPWLDEVLSELNYFLFFGISPLILGLLAATVLGGILFAVMRRGEGGERRNVWPIILIVIGILILLISAAQGGMGWLSVDFIGGWWIILVILGILILLGVALWPLLSGGVAGAGLSLRAILWIFGILLAIALILLAAFSVVPWWVMLATLAGLIILFLLYLLISALYDNRETIPWRPIWIVFIVLLLIGLIALAYSGLVLVMWWLFFLALGIPLLILFLYWLFNDRDGAGSRWAALGEWFRRYPWLRRWLWIIVGLIALFWLGYFLWINFLSGLPWWVWVIIGIIALLIIIFFLRRPNRLYVNLRLAGGRINHFANDRDINTNVNDVDPFAFTAYRGRTRWTAGRLEGAQINFRITNGALAPINGVTNNRGELRTVYTSPAQNGNAVLSLDVTHADIDNLSTVDDYNINILGGPAPQGLFAVPQVDPIQVNTGDQATIRINVDDAPHGAVGNGVNGAQVVIEFPGHPAIPQLNAVTIGGTPGVAAVGSAITPALPAGQYGYTVTVTYHGVTANTAGTIQVQNQVLPDLEIYNVHIVPGQNLRVNQRIRFGFHVRDQATLADIDNANITVLPNTNIALPVSQGNGRYEGSFTPDQTQIGQNILAIQAALNGYNGDAQNLPIQVNDLDQLNVQVIPPNSPMRVGTTEDLTINVQDQVGAAQDATIEILQNGRQIYRNRGNQTVYPFQPQNQGVYTFTINVTEPNFQNFTQTIVVQVNPMLRAQIVANVIDPNNGNAIVNGPIQVGQDVDINVEVIDQNGNQVNVGNVIITPNQFLNVNAGAPIFTARFDSNAAGATLNANNPRQRFNFNVNFNAPGYQNVQQQRVNIDLELAQMVVAFVNNIPPQSPIRVGDPSDINLEIHDAQGNNVPQGTVTFNPGIQNAPANFNNGLYNAQFVPNNRNQVGQQNFTASIEAPGFAPQDIQFIIDVQPIRRIRVRCNWMPEPSTSNRIMLMNFRVFDSVTGDGLEDMRINITDQHAQPINFQNIGVSPITQVTNQNGELAAELRIDLDGRVILRGQGERHNLTIEVTDPNQNPVYPPVNNANAPIALTFHPPRSRLGGPSTVDF
jgi:hypothetical protein